MRFTPSGQYQLHSCTQKPQIGIAALASGSACSRRLCPAGQPQRVGRGGCLRGIAWHAAGSRQMEMWGLLVFRAARSRAGLCAGDLSVRAEGPRFEDGR